MNALTAILCTLIFAAGWFYLTQSRSVELLQALESPRRNAARRKARRLGASSMLILSASFFWLMLEVKWETSRPRMALSLLLVVVMLMTMLLCVLADLYLTMRVRQSTRTPPKR